MRTSFSRRLLFATGTIAVAAAGFVPRAAFPHGKGTLKLADRRLAPGTEIQLVGEKFGNQRRLSLSLVGPAGRVALGDVALDAKGGFTTSLHLPTELAAGPYRLVARATDGDEVAALDVEVVSVPAPAVTAAPSDHDAPSAEPLPLSRARSPWVTGGVLVGIMFAFAGGVFLLRR